MVDRPPQPADDDNTKAQRRRLVWRLAGAGPLVLGLLVVLLLACVLWIPRWLYPPLTETDLQNVSDAAKVQELKGARLKLQNDARTTLLQGLAAVLVLTGAGIGAAVTLRQIKVSQDQLQTTRKQIEHTLESTQQQLNLTEQGQVTNRYTRAVEQLGHERAPVRLGALYSLEHLAQNNPEYRQTVVDVVCAYLRMPYTPPTQNMSDATAQVQEAAPPADQQDRASHLSTPTEDPAQELQVRQTAQRILAAHLQLPEGTSSEEVTEAQRRQPSPDQDFWPGTSLDLTGAALVDLNFARVSVIQARFDGATFHGDAWFRRATFQGYATFGRATFHGDAWFRRATFQGYATFGRATFHGDAWFDEATFIGQTEFNEATFRRDARFDRATFQGYAKFNEATFQSDAGFRKATFQGGGFDRATFQGYARFNEATFQSDAGFGEATFQSYAGFDRATFQGYARFNEATFQSDAWFRKATFQGGGFDRATFRRYAWFDGATFQRYAGFDGATFRADAGFNGATFIGDTQFDRVTFAGDNGVKGVAGAQVLHLDDPDLNKHRMWPDGWTVRPDPADPTRGTLVLAEQVEEPEWAVPPADPTANNGLSPE